MLSLDGTVYNFEAYGMENITGALSMLSREVIQVLFPRLDDRTIHSLMRARNVDILIGAKHPSWHPDRAEPATGSDGDLWLYRGRFGVCVGGRHPLIQEETRKLDSLFHVNHIYHVNELRSPDSYTSHELEFCPNRVMGYSNSQPSSKTGVVSDALVSSEVPAEPSPIRGVESALSGKGVSTEVSAEPSPVRGVESALSGKDELDSRVLSSSEVPSMNCLSSAPITDVASVSQAVQSFGTKAKVMKEDEMFFQLENLGVMIDPQCGGCRCASCPIVGSKYSFSEQKQHDLIKKNLIYDELEKRWVTEYPWKVARDTLPRNEKIALQSLHAMEKRLSHDEELAQDFCKQIEDMVARGAAVILTDEEISAWEGDYYYLSLVGIKGKKKWLRICFDASRKQGGCVSMNDCLYKGPDRFMNNLLSVCLGFRNGRVAAAADLSKFHNQVKLVPADVHMQRFLWRGMRTDEAPQTLAVAVNNFGVKPANCIATLALHKSAEIFEDKYPEASHDIKEQTYIDDELVAAENDAALHLKTEQMDEITTHAGMRNKGWTFSGDDVCPDIQIGSEVSDVEEERVLGLLWVPKTDNFRFQAKLRLKVSSGEGTLDVLINSEDHLDNVSDNILLTRKVVLSNVMKVFDPIGLLSPLILRAKLLLRETWSVAGLGWDDPLPTKEKDDWLKFFISLLQLNDIEIPRSLWPEGEVEGLPMLVIFSDGSISAYGVAAYIRWQMKDGSFWSRLIMAKSKLAPKRIISVPRMELCGAVMGNRVKNFLLKETNLKFSKVVNLVDSSTILRYLHKECRLFGQFEGPRIAKNSIFQRVQ